jgi:hypothetical protein
MHFSKRGDFYQAAYISGPRHVFLAVAFAAAPVEHIIVEALPPAGACTHGPLDSVAILAAVERGLAAANQEFRLAWAMRHIQYVSNDTGPEYLYELIVRRIVERRVQGQPFVESHC